VNTFNLLQETNRFTSEGDKSGRIIRVDLHQKKEHQLTNFSLITFPSLESATANVSPSQ